jgi:hypothetical protein
MFIHIIAGGKLRLSYGIQVCMHAIEKSSCGQLGGVMFLPFINVFLSA